MSLLSLCARQGIRQLPGTISQPAMAQNPSPYEIGGSVNRTADRLLNLGTDLPDAKVMHRELVQTESGIKLFLIVNNKAEELSLVEVSAVPPNLIRCD